MRWRIALAAVLLAAAPARAADPPRYVAGPASGYQYECEQAKQAVPRLAALVTRIPDLDGDGQPEHVLEAAKGCDAVRLLYCSDAEGCRVSVYLSSWSGIAETFRARSWKAVKGEMAVVAGGPACGGAGTCTLTYRWTGSRLLPVQ